MTLPIPLPRKKVSPPPASEKEPVCTDDAYQRYTTMTLQSTLVNLRVTMLVHGPTPRATEIRDKIIAELERRGEPV